MPKRPRYSDKIKAEEPDPKAFDRFKDFAKRIVQVSKDDVDDMDKDDSHSTSPHRST